MPGDRGRLVAHWRRTATGDRREVVVAGAILLALVLVLAAFVLAGRIALSTAVGGFLLVSMVAAVALAGLRHDEQAPAADASAVDAARGEAVQHVLDALPDPVLITDGGGRLTRINRAGQLGYPHVRPGAQIQLFSRDPQFLSALDHLRADGVASTLEVQERVPIERRLLVTIAPAPDFDATAEGHGAIIALRDLTEQDRLMRMRADFVANASHELRTPLAALSGFIETLQGRAKEDAVARERFLSIMSREAARMTRLIDDLLSLSRVEIREHVAPTARVDIGAVVAEVVRSLAPVADEAGIKLTSIGDDDATFVRGDHDELVQVVHNLTQNAIKYGSEGGRVELRVARDGTGDRRRVTVSVIDDGPGIAPDHLPRLTERFYRTNAKTSRDKGGTGLGLAIVKHIVNRHRGELRITSTLGVGSTFAITLDEEAS